MPKLLFCQNEAKVPHRHFSNSHLMWEAAIFVVYSWCYVLFVSLSIFKHILYFDWLIGCSYVELCGDCNILGNLVQEEWHKFQRKGNRFGFSMGWNYHPYSGLQWLRSIKIVLSIWLFLVGRLLFSASFLLVIYIKFVRSGGYHVLVLS